MIALPALIDITVKVQSLVGYISSEVIAVLLHFCLIYFKGIDESSTAFHIYLRRYLGVLVTFCLFTACYKADFGWLY